jgi:hypothetical protein
VKLLSRVALQLLLVHQSQVRVGAHPAIRSLPKDYHPVIAEMLTLVLRQ